MKVVINTKQELLNTLHHHQSKIVALGVTRLGIFGSFVRNDVKEKSDVDFYVEFDPAKKKFDNFMDLAFLLEEITGRKIELITPQSLSPHTGKYILNEVEYVSLAA